MPPNGSRKKIVFTAISLEEARRQLEKLEERLHECTLRFRALVEATSDWIWETDAHGVYTYASSKVKALLGYDPKEMLGRTPFDFMPPQDAKRIKAEFARSAKKGRPFARLENINLHKNGRRVVLETSGVPILAEDGTLQGWHGIARDITQRKQQQEGLRAVNACFLSFGADADKNIWSITRAAGVILNATCALYNRKEGDILATTASWHKPADMPARGPGPGRICFDLLDRDAQEPLIIKNLMRSSYAVTDPNVKKYGLQTYIGYPVRLKNRPVAALCAAFQSDAEIADWQLDLFQVLGKAASIEESRRQVHAELQQSFRRMTFAREDEKTKLSSELHDQTGSAAVTMNSYLALLEEDLAENNPRKARKNLNRARGTFRDLVKTLKNISSEIRPPAMSISGLAGAINELAASIRTRTGIRISVNNWFSDGAAADERIKITVYRILKEALNNAVAHSGAETFSMDLRSSQGRLMIEAVDDGCGFDVAARPKDPARPALGLKIMQDEAESVGGTLRIDSRRGRGTTIKCELPMKIIKPLA